MLAKEPDICVVGEASSAREAIDKANELQPDVILMDIKMPDMTGTEAVRAIKKARPATSIIMFTMYDSDIYVIEALKAGASGYLTKDTPKELLCQTIRSAPDGGIIVRSQLLQQAVDTLLQTSHGRRREPAGSLAERITPRELEVLRLLAQGYANKDISRRLNIAEITVKKHVQSLVQKLGASDRTHAAILGVRLGLIE